MGFIPADAATFIAARLAIPYALVESVASFYSFLHLQPAGEFIWRFMQHVLPGGFKRIRHYGLIGPRRTRWPIWPPPVPHWKRPLPTPRWMDGVSAHRLEWDSGIKRRFEIAHECPQFPCQAHAPHASRLTSQGKTLQSP